MKTLFTRFIAIILIPAMLQQPAPAYFGFRSLVARRLATEFPFASEALSEPDATARFIPGAINASSYPLAYKVLTEAFGIPDGSSASFIESHPVSGLPMRFGSRRNGPRNRASINPPPDKSDPVWEKKVLDYLTAHRQNAYTAKVLAELLGLEGEKVDRTTIRAALETLSNAVNIYKHSRGMGRSAMYSFDPDPSNLKGGYHPGTTDSPTREHVRNVVDKFGQPVTLTLIRFELKYWHSVYRDLRMHLASLVADGVLAVTNENPKKYYAPERIAASPEISHESRQMPMVVQFKTLAPEARIDFAAIHGDLERSVEYCDLSWEQVKAMIYASRSGSQRISWRLSAPDGERPNLDGSDFHQGLMTAGLRNKRLTIRLEKAGPDQRIDVAIQQQVYTPFRVTRDSQGRVRVNAETAEPPADAWSADPAAIARQLEKYITQALEAYQLGADALFRGQDSFHIHFDHRQGLSVAETLRGHDGQLGDMEFADHLLDGGMDRALNVVVFKEVYNRVYDQDQQEALPAVLRTLLDVMPYAFYEALEDLGLSGRWLLEIMQEVHRHEFGSEMSPSSENARKFLKSPGILERIASQYLDKVDRELGPDWRYTDHPVLGRIEKRQMPLANPRGSSTNAATLEASEPIVKIKVNGRRYKKLTAFVRAPSSLYAARPPDHSPRPNAVPDAWGEKIKIFETESGVNWPLPELRKMPFKEVHELAQHIATVNKALELVIPDDKRRLSLIKSMKLGTMRSPATLEKLQWACILSQSLGVEITPREQAKFRSQPDLRVVEKFVENKAGEILERQPGGGIPWVRDSFRRAVAAHFTEEFNRDKVAALFKTIMDQIEEVSGRRMQGLRMYRLLYSILGAAVQRLNRVDVVPFLEKLQGPHISATRGDLKYLEDAINLICEDLITRRRMNLMDPGRPGPRNGKAGESAEGRKTNPRPVGDERSGNPGRALRLSDLPETTPEARRVRAAREIVRNKRFFYGLTWDDIHAIRGIIGQTYPGVPCLQLDGLVEVNLEGDTETTYALRYDGVAKAVVTAIEGAVISFQEYGASDFRQSQKRPDLFLEYAAEAVARYANMEGVDPSVLFARLERRFDRVIVEYREEGLDFPETDLNPAGRDAHIILPALWQPPGVPGLDYAAAVYSEIGHLLYPEEGDPAVEPRALQAFAARHGVGRLLDLHADRYDSDLHEHRDWVRSNGLEAALAEYLWDGMSVFSRRVVEAVLTLLQEQELSPELLRGDGNAREGQADLLGKQSARLGRSYIEFIFHGLWSLLPNRTYVGLDGQLTTRLLSPTPKGHAPQTAPTGGSPTSSPPGTWNKLRRNPARSCAKGLSEKC